MKERSRTSRNWECAFAQDSIKTVDSQVDSLWRSTFGVGRTPFGDLRNQFRRQHCRTLNPYGSDTCPYPRDACARAFLRSVQLTCNAKPRSPVGYFIKVAKTTGAIRADEKPNRSTKVLTSQIPPANVRTDVSPEASDENRTGRLGQPSPPLTEAGPGLRRSDVGPVGIGDVFRSLDLRPRQREGDEREASSE